MANYDGHYRNAGAIESSAATQVGEANVASIGVPNQATPDPSLADTKFFQFTAKALAVGEVRATLADATLSSAGVVT